MSWVWSIFIQAQGAIWYFISTVKSSKYGAAQCYLLIGGCQGAATSTSWTAQCYPDIIWTSKAGGSGYYSPDLAYGSISYGACSTGICPASMAFTVRCVLDLAYVFDKKIKLKC